MKKRKRLLMRFVSLFIIICIILNNTNVYASASIRREINNNYKSRVHKSTEDEESIKLIYKKMTPEAKTLFKHYMMTYDNEMLTLHNAYVDDKIETLNNNMSLNATTSIKITSSLASQLSTLGKELSLLGLSDAVKYALMSAGSSILAALADGPLVVGDIVAIFVVAGCSAVLIANWKEVSGNWSKIVSAFKKAFKDDVSSKTFNLVFGNVKPRYADSYQVMQTLNIRVKSAPSERGVGKHIDVAVTSEIIRKSTPIGIYYSEITKKALFVYKIPNGTRADINIDYNSHQNWQEEDFNISGAKLFVIYDCRNHKLIHAHIRLYRDDTESMRYGNKMSWQVSPYVYYDDKYEYGGGTTWLWGDIKSK